MNQKMRLAHTYPFWLEYMICSLHFCRLGLVNRLGRTMLNCNDIFVYSQTWITSFHNLYPGSHYALKSSLKTRVLLHPKQTQLHLPTPATEQTKEEHILSHPCCQHNSLSPALSPNYVC